MKKWLLVLMALLLAAAVVFAAAEEEEDAEGEVLFLEEALQAGDPDAELPEESEPYIPDDAVRTILGRDDRVTVRNTREYPYSAIAYMHMTYKCGCKATGTGFMVSQNKLLTAAHCLVCSEHNQWAKGITFYFGYNKSNGKYLYKYNDRWTAYAATYFPNGYTPENDWGYVKLNRNVGDKVGWFGRRYLNDADLEKGWYYVAGYRDGVLKYDFGKVRVISPTRMYVDMDVLPGNSGSPIYDSDDYAVGIWTTYNDTLQYNTGFRLTTTLKNIVNNDN